jgi:hypothetical protein
MFNDFILDLLNANGFALGFDRQDILSVDATITCVLHVIHQQVLGVVNGGLATLQMLGDTSPAGHGAHSPIGLGKRHSDNFAFGIGHMVFEKVCHDEVLSVVN